MNLLLAAILATMANNAGGKVAITDTKGSCPEHQFMALTYNQAGETSTGCWFYLDGLIMVKWEGKTVRTYEAGGFELVELVDDE